MNQLIILTLFLCYLTYKSFSEYGPKFFFSALIITIPPYLLFMYVIEVNYLLTVFWVYLTDTLVGASVIYVIQFKRGKVGAEK